MPNKDCVFCKIIKEQQEASIVYENEAVLAFMDARQANPGHVLVIPKHHFENIYALSEEAGTAIMHCLILISQAIKQAFDDIDGLSIWQSNGPGAYQEVPHVHFHIHPRKVGDGLLKVYSSRPQRLTIEERDHYAQKIRNRLPRDINSEMI